ncbi:hypothetical protein C9374_000689 [Naegleria lovaniensis]|uniref:Uncharacterized protein n=1 Tax=Naegleria lovaniensis TaxID=51637 RepID=A0AA88KM39_NAELO|nr:uncharacterized protein C9374_000689 [Naegleria lovaniensis]KAG2388525.1 hypothetical protein C9374_000689 [Naegleria lovaniensis]
MYATKRAFSSSSESENPVSRNKLSKSHRVRSWVLVITFTLLILYIIVFFELFRKVAKQSVVPDQDPKLLRHYEYEDASSIEQAKQELKTDIGGAQKSSSSWALKTLGNNDLLITNLLGETVNQNILSKTFIKTDKNVEFSIFQSCLEDRFNMPEQTLVTEKLQGIDVSNEMINGKYFVVWNTFGHKHPNGPIYSAGTSLINKSTQKLRVVALKWSLNYDDLTENEHVEGDICLVRKSKGESEVSSGSEVYCVHEMVRQPTKHIHTSRNDEMTWLDSGVEVKPNFIVRLNSVTECKGHPRGFHDKNWTRIDGQLIILTEKGVNYCMQKYQKEHQNISEEEVNKRMAPLVSVRSPIHDRSFVVTPFPAYGPYSTFVNNNYEIVSVRGCFVFLSFLSHGPAAFTELHVYKNNKLVWTHELILYESKNSVPTLRHMIPLPDTISKLNPKESLSMRVMCYTQDQVPHVIDFAVYALATGNLDIPNDRIILTWDISKDGMDDFFHYNTENFELRSEYTKQAHDTQYAFIGPIPNYDKMEVIEQNNEFSVLRFTRKQNALCVIVLVRHKDAVILQMKLCNEQLVPKSPPSLHCYGLIRKHEDDPTKDRLVRFRVDPQQRRVFISWSNNVKLLEEIEIGQTYEMEENRFFVSSVFVDIRKTNVFAIVDRRGQLPPHYFFYDNKANQWSDTHAIFGSPNSTV